MNKNEIIRMYIKDLLYLMNKSSTRDARIEFLEDEMDDEDIYEMIKDIFKDITCPNCSTEDIKMHRSLSPCGTTELFCSTCGYTVHTSYRENESQRKMLNRLKRKWVNKIPYDSELPEFTQVASNVDYDPLANFYNKLYVNTVDLDEEIQEAINKDLWDLL